MIELKQTWPHTKAAKEIVIFGAGSIVADAHLPAYKKAGLPVAGLYDPDHDKAKNLAAAWGISAYDSLDAAIDNDDVVYDLATPPAAHVDILSQLPVESPALIQKPMGNDLEEATQILKVCTDRQLKAAVNFSCVSRPCRWLLKVQSIKAYWERWLILMPG